MATEDNTPSILFIGDINVDVMMGGLAQFPVRDREITCTSYEVMMGSTAVIAAAAYSGLGGRSAFLGLAGKDDYGDFMLRGMAELGIDTSRVLRTDCVGTGVTVNLVEGRHRTQVTYPGAIAAFELKELDPALFDGIQHVHFAGPYLQTRFRPSITAVLDAAREREITTSLDPQWDATETWQDMHDWLPRLDLLFVNEDEARSIAETDDSEAACRALAKRTPLPVLKLGAKGAMLLADGKTVSAPPIDVKVVDTTGAGDNFDAAFLFASLAKGMGPVEAMTFANAAASRSCMFAGGCAARSTYEDVIELMQRT